MKINANHFIECERVLAPNNITKKKIKETAMHESLQGACSHLRIKITQGLVGLLTTSHNLIIKRGGC